MTRTFDSSKVASRLVVAPGVSIIGIDAGTTTGVAVWDAWDQKLYVDQIDAGRGRKVRYRVQAGVIESSYRRDIELLFAKGNEALTRKIRAGGGLGDGRRGVLETQCVVERGVTTILCNMIMACGPKTIVVIEDFILGITGGAASGARDGLSSVRIANRLDQEMYSSGLLSGDAWRIWQGHGWGGVDRRGWHVAGGAVPQYKLRLGAVEDWRIDGKDDHMGTTFSEGSRAWSGGGVKVVWQMPGQRTFLRTVAAMDDWMREHELWLTDYRHGMDAAEHVAVMARKLSAEIQGPPNRLWPLSAKIRSNRKTAKSALLPN